MAAASDKARYFLEQSIPELKEYERKNIFSSEEISSIARKRSDFEHKINARGSSPADYARYAEFEINVDSLRRRRVKRLAIKSTTRNGQRRIFFVFDRGTRKHPGDVGLWMQSIEYAKKQKAHKKLSHIFTSVLRLHPTKSELWIYAAQFATDEHGDMTEARGYMQRGMRFCKSSRKIWLEYIRLEMSYMAKVHARRQILGLRDLSPNTDPHSHMPDEDEDENIMRLPRTTSDDINSTSGAAEVNVLRYLDSTPALGGAIPIAIYDAAMSQFNNDTILAYEIFNLMAEYHQLQATVSMLLHIDEHVLNHNHHDWAAQACHVRLPLVGVPRHCTGFPAAFREFLQRLKKAQLETRQHAELLRVGRESLQGIIDDQDVDPAIHAIAESTSKSLERR